MFPVLYSPNETVYCLGFLTSRIQEAYLNADPDPKHRFTCVDPDPYSEYESGSTKLLNADKDPQQC